MNVTFLLCRNVVILTFICLKSSYLQNLSNFVTCLITYVVTSGVHFLLLTLVLHNFLYYMCFTSVITIVKLATSSLIPLRPELVKTSRLTTAHTSLLFKTKQIFILTRAVMIYILERSFVVSMYHYNN